MGVGFFGFNSIATLAAISYERYLVITSSNCRLAVASWRIEHRKAQKVICSEFTPTFIKLMCFQNKCNDNYRALLFVSGFAADP